MVTNILAVGTQTKGQMVLDGNLRIEGRFEGLIETKGRVYIAQTAQVYAEIHAHDVVVGGLLVGPVFASHGVKLLRTGRLHGDIYAPHMTTEDGGSFHAFAHNLGNGGGTTP